MNQDAFGNRLPDDTRGVRFRNWLRRRWQWIRDEAKYNWDMWLIYTVIFAAIAGCGFWIYKMATHKPDVVITLDRSEWACTQSTTRLVFVTKQGIPLNNTTCTQWSYQP